MSADLDEILAAFLQLVEAHEAERDAPLEDPDATNFRCDDCIGCVHCRFCTSCRNCDECTYCDACRDCLKCTQCRGCTACESCTHSNYSAQCSGSAYLTLCFDCEECIQCFACVGLRKQEFCILNESYRRADYFKKVNELRTALDAKLLEGWHAPWELDELEESEGEAEGDEEALDHSEASNAGLAASDRSGTWPPMSRDQAKDLDHSIAREDVLWAEETLRTAPASLDVRGKTTSQTAAAGQEGASADVSSGQVAASRPEQGPVEADEGAGASEVAALPPPDAVESSFRGVGRALHELERARQVSPPPEPRVEPVEAAPASPASRFDVARAIPGSSGESSRGDGWRGDAGATVEASRGTSGEGSRRAIDSGGTTSGEESRAGASDAGRAGTPNEGVRAPENADVDRSRGVANEGSRAPGTADVDRSRGMANEGSRAPGTADVDRSRGVANEGSRAPGTADVDRFRGMATSGGTASEGPRAQETAGVDAPPASSMRPGPSGSIASVEGFRGAPSNAGLRGAGTSGGAQSTEVSRGPGTSAAATTTESSRGPAAAAEGWRGTPSAEATRAPTPGGEISRFAGSTNTEPTRAASPQVEASRPSASPSRFEAGGQQEEAESRPTGSRFGAGVPSPAPADRTPSGGSRWREAGEGEPSTGARFGGAGSSTAPVPDERRFVGPSSATPRFEGVPRPTSENDRTPVPSEDDPSGRSKGGSASVRTAKRPTRR